MPECDINVVITRLGILSDDVGAAGRVASLTT